jgi:hypothetical protein
VDIEDQTYTQLQIELSHDAYIIQFQGFTYQATQWIDWTIFEKELLLGFSKHIDFAKRVLDTSDLDYQLYYTGGTQTIELFITSSQHNRRIAIKHVFGVPEEDMNQPSFKRSTMILKNSS